MKLVFRSYGPGLVEFGYSKHDSSAIPRNLEGGVVRLESTPEEIAERAARRARTVIRRRVMSLGLDHLLTLTYRSNMIDFGVAVKDLRSYMKIIRVAMPGFRWVAVPERQARGAWHWHIAVKGFQNVRFLREAWRRVVGDGNIDVKGPGRKLRIGKLRLAYYLVKYISKSADNVSAGTHRYYGTRERGDVTVEKIELDRVGSAMKWITEILEVQGQIVRQSIESAFGGWGATWQKIGRMERMIVSSCTG